MGTPLAARPAWAAAWTSPMSNIHKHQHIAASMLQGPCSRVTALRGSRLGRICHLAKALAAVKQHVTWRKDTALLVCTPASWQPAWAFGRPCPLCPGPPGPCPLERHRARPAERPCLCPALALDCAMSFRKAQLPLAAWASSLPHLLFLLH